MSMIPIRSVTVGSVSSRLTLAALVLAALGSNADIAAMADPWEGVWAFEKDWCQFADQIGEHDPAPIKITRSEFVGLENRCIVTSRDSKSGEIVLDMSCEGEGETYEDRMFLSVNDDTLKIRSEGGEATKYYRCK